jgi:O-antigen/teichoic acid export membrane protein
VKTIVRNVFANWMGLAINMGIAFLIAPFLVHSLGDTMYGLWVLLLAVTGYMGLLDAGLKVSVVKYISRYNALGDKESMSRVVSTVLVLHGSIAIAIVILGVAMAPFVPRLFSVSPELVPVAQTVLVITAVNLAITIWASVFNGVLAGLQRYDYSNMIGVGVMLVRSALIVLLVSRGQGIVALGLVHTAGNVLAALLAIVVVFKTVDGLHVRWSLVNRETVKTLCSYGGFILLNNLAMFLLFNSAEIVIGVFLSAAAVTYFAIAGNLLQYLSQLIGVMTQVLHPYAADQDARGDAGGLQRTVIVGTKVCLMIALPATVTFMIAGKTFISLWMGPKYAEAAAPLLIVMAIGRLFWLSQSSTGNVLLGANRHKLLTMTNMATGVAGLVLGSLLITRLGLFGLALGMAIPMVISQGVILPRVALKAFSIPAGQLLREGYLQPFLATLPYAALLGALMMVVRPAGFLELGLVLLAALPALVVSMYFLCLSAGQRRLVAQVYSKWLPAAAAPEGLR